MLLTHVMLVTCFKDMVFAVRLYSLGEKGKPEMWNARDLFVETHQRKSEQEEMHGQSVRVER